MALAVEVEDAPHQVLGDVQGQHLHDADVRVHVGRAGAEEDAVRVFEDGLELAVALGRIGRIEDVMGAVLFLCSDASALVTGSALMLDGGWTAA